MTKIAAVTFALLMLGSSAALAQRYGYHPYGYRPYGYGAGDYVCGRYLPNVVNYIIDPATGRPITQAEYQARYPWTDTSSWTYDCANNLWTDHTPQGYQQSQNYERHRGYGRWRR